MYHIIFSDKAVQELQQSFDWYEHKKAGLGEKFLTVIEQSLHILSSSPLSFPEKIKSYREIANTKVSLYHNLRNYKRKQNLHLTHFSYKSES